MKKKTGLLQLLIVILFFCSMSPAERALAAVDQQSAPTVDSSTSENGDDTSVEGTTSDQKAFFEQIDQYNSQLDKMRHAINGLTGDEQNAQALQILETERQLRKKLGELILTVQETKDEENSNAEIIEKIKILLIGESAVIQNEINYVQERITDLKKGQEELKPLELVSRQQEIVKKYQIFDGLLKDLLENSRRMQVVGVSSTGDFAVLDKLLEQRSIKVSSEIKLIIGKLSDLRKQHTKASGSDQEKLNTEMLAIEEEKKGASESLAKLVDLMHAREMETTEYSELLIKSTGQISSEILDSSVAFSLVGHGIDFAREWARENGIRLLVKFLFVIFLLFSFKLFAGLVKRLVRRAIGGESSTVSLLMSNFIVSISGKLVMLIGLLVALSQLGVKIAPLLAGLGIAGFIVGFALQDVLSNFASGVMILIYRPFDVGDSIEVPDVSGRVQHMNLVSTIILTYDNQKLVVPNNKIWGNIIRNIHSERIRRVDLTFGIGYEDDIDHAERVLREILEGHELVLDEPKFTIKLHALSESSVDFVVRPWTLTANYWDVYWDVTRAVKERFDAEGISIPYPQRDVHVQNLSSLPASNIVHTA